MRVVATTLKKVIAPKNKLRFQYRKRYESSCNKIKKWRKDLKTLISFNTASGMRVVATKGSNVWLSPTIFVSIPQAV